MKNLTGPIIVLHFMRHNTQYVVIDTTHGLIHFPHLTMEVENAAKERSVKPLSVVIQDVLTKSPMTTKTITAIVDHPSEWNRTGTVTSLEKFTETATLLISHTISMIIDKKVAVRVTKTTESPYTLRKERQISEFSVVTPEQSKFIRPVDRATLSVITEGDSDLTTHLNGLLRTSKPEQQNSTL